MNIIETINNLVRTSRQMLLEIGRDLDECAIEIFAAHLTAGS